MRARIGTLQRELEAVVTDSSPSSSVTAVVASKRCGIVVNYSAGFGVQA
jgi:hypothetical protein